MQPRIPTISLDQLEGLGLIIQWSSGVSYTNQVAGYGCEHPRLEGVFVPLSDDIGHPALYALQQHFHGDWSPLNERDADIVDGILRRSELGFLVTNRAKLVDSREAWVWVNIRDDHRPHYEPPFDGFGLPAAVLTWPNSD